MITYFEPFAAAWARAQRMLFRPFRLDAWLALGLLAFLTNLGRGFGGGGGGGGRPGKSFRGPGDFSHVGDDIARGVHDFFAQPWIAAAIGVLIVCGLVFVVLVAWLRARGSLMFADDVARESTDLVAAWRRTSRHAMSLFLLELLVLGVMIAAFAAMLAWPFADMVSRMLHEGVFRPPHFVTILPALLMIGPLLVAGAIVAALTYHFVVPVMLKHDLNAFAAWGRFGGLLGANLAHFVAALLLLLVARIGVGIAVFVVGMLTCCVGWIVLGIPYVGDVILLPVHTTFRGFGIDFLAQFGPEWDLRAPAQAPAPEPRA